MKELNRYLRRSTWNTPLKPQRIDESKLIRSTFFPAELALIDGRDEVKVRLSADGVELQIGESDYIDLPIDAQEAVWSILLDRLRRG